MHLFCLPRKLNHALLYGILGTVSLSMVIPPPAYSFDFNLKDANFVIKMEKLVDKLMKYKDKLDSDKVIDIMLDIKHEIESYTGKNIDLKKELEKVEKDIKKEAKISSKEFKPVKELILSKEKKSKNRAMCMLSYLQEDPGINFEEYEYIYDAARGKENDKEEFKVSAQMAIGATLVLAGGLMAILGLEFPPVMELAKYTAGMGMGMIVNDFAEQKNNNPK